MFTPSLTILQLHTFASKESQNCLLLPGFKGHRISKWRELKSRKAKVILIGTEGDNIIKKLGNDVFFIP